jgi:membrane protein
MLEKLLRNRRIKQLIGWAQRNTLFRGTVSFYDILRNLVHSNRKFDIDQRASAVAYSLTLASFPAVIFLFTLIPYIPIADLDKQIMTMLQEAMPRGTFEDADQTIMDILSRPRRGVLSFGFIFAMIASTNGMMSLMLSFDMVFEDEETRGFLEKRGIAILLTLVLIVVLVLAVLMLIVGDAVIGLMRDWHVFQDEWVIFTFNITRYLITFGSLMLAISIIYRFAPSHGKRYAFFNIGTIIASILILAATFAFSFYLSRFNSYNKLYGSIGTLIALMIWYYLLAFLIILGFEINASIDTARRRARKRLRTHRAE